MTVVRLLWEQVDWVQLPAVRPFKTSQKSTDKFVCAFLACGVFIRLRSNLFYQKLVMNESPATASLRSATPKKNVPCFSDLRAPDFF